jgi:urea transport system ATP-binding protein
VFESHTVEDNILLALRGRARRLSRRCCTGSPGAERARIDELLALVKLGDQPAVNRAEQSQPWPKQWLEIGCCWRRNPALLLRRRGPPPA